MYKYQQMCTYLCAMWLAVGSIATHQKECPVGLYGDDCQKLCPPTCKSEICHPSSLCVECSRGFFGISCNRPCPTTCAHRACHRYNVSCVHGCVSGWYGKKCNLPCEDCAGPCHRETGRCHDNTGAAHAEFLRSPPGCGFDSKQKDRCTPGCRGATCDTPCPDGCILCEKHGENCTSCSAGKCGHFCNRTCPASCRSSCDRYGDCVGTIAESLYGMLSDEEDSNDAKIVIILATCGSVILVAVAVFTALWCVFRSQPSKTSESARKPKEHTDDSNVEARAIDLGRKDDKETDQFKETENLLHMKNDQAV